MMPGKSSGNRGRQHHHHHQHYQIRRRKSQKMASGSPGDHTANAEGVDAFADLDGETHQLLDVTAPQSKMMTRATHEETENVWSISVQVFIPFLVAGLGMVGAGLVLDVVQVGDLIQVCWCD
jgi:solute carrier family 41